MHDRLLAHQDDLTLAGLSAHAAAIRLDVDRFQTNLAGRAGAARVAEDVESADLSGVAGTPTFFINGRRHHGPYDITTLAAAVRAASERATMAQDRRHGRQPRNG